MSRPAGPSNIKLVGMVIVPVQRSDGEGAKVKLIFNNNHFARFEVLDKFYISIKTYDILKKIYKESNPEELEKLISTGFDYRWFSRSYEYKNPLM